MEDASTSTTAAADANFAGVVRKIAGVEVVRERACIYGRTDYG